MKGSPLDMEVERERVRHTIKMRSYLAVLSPPRGRAAGDSKTIPQNMESFDT